MALPPKFVPVRITIREDQNEWLLAHPEINLSGLVQAAIQKEIDLRTAEIPPGFVTGAIWPSDAEPPEGWKFVERKTHTHEPRGQIENDPLGGSSEISKDLAKKMKLI